MLARACVCVFVFTITCVQLSQSAILGAESLQHRARDVLVLRAQHDIGWFHNNLCQKTVFKNVQIMLILP